MTMRRMALPGTAAATAGAVAGSGLVCAPVGGSAAGTGADGVACGAGGMSRASGAGTGGAAGTGGTGAAAAGATPGANRCVGCLSKGGAAIGSEGNAAPTGGTFWATAGGAAGAAGVETAAPGRGRAAPDSAKIPSLSSICAVFSEEPLAAEAAGGTAIASATAAGAGAGPAASIGPVPFSSHAIDRSGKAARMRCTTSRLGLLRPDSTWLTMGRATPTRSANWVVLSWRSWSRALMRSTISK